MNIPELIKEHHQAMIDKGFYICPECKGNETLEGYPDNDCKTCHGSGIDPNKNIGELLMLIVTELSEALEAHRNNNFCTFNRSHHLNIDNLLPPGIGESEFNGLSVYQECFEYDIKDIFEDELTDTRLRLFDFCGYLNIKPNYQNVKTKSLVFTDNVGENIGKISKLVLSFNIDITNRVAWMNYILNSLDVFCEKYNIPIEKHILAKIVYNKTRPHKHGKEY